MHISQVADALRTTVSPGFRFAGGVRVTGRSVSPSKPLPKGVPWVSERRWGVGHSMSLALQPGGRLQASAVGRPVPGFFQ